jgi:hypothetical protein
MLEEYLMKREKELKGKGYKQLVCFFKKYKNVIDLVFEDEIIECFNHFADETKKKYLYNILMYRREVKLEYSVIEKECLKLKTKIEENNKNKTRNLPTVNIKNERNQLEELYYKLKTTLPALRSDLSTVKVNNFDINSDNYYKDGEIVFNNLVKVGLNKPLKLKVSDEVKEYIFNYNFKNDYLLDFESADRNNYECSVLCKKVFGITISEYRKKYITEKFKDKVSVKDILTTANEICKECNTSLDMIVNYYFCEC